MGQFVIRQQGHFGRGDGGFRRAIEAGTDVTHVALELDLLAVLADPGGIGTQAGGLEAAIEQHPGGIHIGAVIIGKMQHLARRQGVLQQAIGGETAHREVVDHEVRIVAELAAVLAVIELRRSFQPQGKGAEGDQQQNREQPGGRDGGAHWLP